MSHWLLISNHWPVGIKSAPQSLWESNGSRALSIKGTPHQAAFLTPNHSHYSPWIFHSNLNCFTCISQVVGQKNAWCIKSCYIFHTRISFIDVWEYRAWTHKNVSKCVCIGAPLDHEATTQKSSLGFFRAHMKYQHEVFTLCPYSKLNSQTEILIKRGAAIWLFNGTINWLWNSHVKSLYIVNREFLCK